MHNKISAHEFFKALSDPTRLAIIQMLKQQGEMCVCDITAKLAQPQPTISRHLTKLKTLGLLQSERRGTWIWYKIDQNLPPWGLQVIDCLPN